MTKEIVFIQGQMVDLNLVHQITTPIINRNDEISELSHFTLKTYIIKAGFVINFINDNPIQITAEIFRPSELKDKGSESTIKLKMEDHRAIIQQRFDDFVAFHRSIVEYVAKLPISEVPKFNFKIDENEKR